MKAEFLPKPKKIIPCSGNLVVPAGGRAREARILVSDRRAQPAADLLANKFGARAVSGVLDGSACIRLRIVKELNFARNLRAELRAEAYRLEVKPDKIDIAALTAEGLLRAAATLLQLRRRKGKQWTLPCMRINDWPDFRYRCAADWLVNVECNRWAYDRGDGREAFLNRIKRKLDFCFEHKINMVWFDGFGWDVNRFPGYAALMRECNRYARRLGIKLLFGGYGGGYGTAYQAGEIYRCGYFGRVYLNRRPYPGGKKYACRGWTEYNDGQSRFYGTCLSNAALRIAKIEAMKRFVSEVNPGVMYIHEIDAGTWMQSEATWRNRCPECRKRWPNDELDAADGQAGAFASWFRQVRSELSALPGCGDYLPARDLTVAFVSPLYTEHSENKPANVWEREMNYYRELSRLIGPEPGILFGFREMFFDSKDRKKMADLRRIVERNGNGHGLLVAAFAGGDNYYSDDLANISGSLAHFYEGAEAVYISNGGVHQEPIHMMNADFLWNSSAAGYRENPRNEAETEKTLAQIKKGMRKPKEIFAAGGYFDRLCGRLWGKKAGTFMSHALQAEHDGQRAVGHVWWSITKALAELKVEPTSPAYVAMNCYDDRKLASEIALGYARRAAMTSDSDDIRWFVKCLEVGKRFAGAIDLLFRLKLGYDQSALLRLHRLLHELKAYIRKIGVMKRTDILGGEPGCWMETIAEIQKLGRLFAGQKRVGTIFSDFIHKWRVSSCMPADARLSNLKYPVKKAGLKMARQCFPEAFCDIHEDRFAKSKTDACVFYTTGVNFAEPMQLEFRLGYDGPVKVWADGRQLFHDPSGTNPGRIDKAIIPWEFKRGKHELMIALGSNKGNACGIFARFCRTDNPARRKKMDADYQTMASFDARD